MPLITFIHKENIAPARAAGGGGLRGGVWWACWHPPKREKLK